MNEKKRLLKVMKDNSLQLQAHLIEKDGFGGTMTLAICSSFAHLERAHKEWWTRYRAQFGPQGVMDGPSLSIMVEVVDVGMKPVARAWLPYEDVEDIWSRMEGR